MELLKKERLEIQAACLRLACVLHEIGYINERDRRELVLRITAGDKTAYSELKALLVEIAEEVGKN